MLKLEMRLVSTVRQNQRADLWLQNRRFSLKLSKNAKVLQSWMTVFCGFVNSSEPFTYTHLLQRLYKNSE